MENKNSLVNIRFVAKTSEVSSNVEQYFSENIRSDVKRSEVATLSKTPTTVTWSASSKICCHVIVTQQRSIVEQFAPEFLNLPLQAKNRI